MTSVVYLLRDFWRLGVRVQLHEDRFRLVPPGIAPESLRHVLREHRSDVAALVLELPAPGRCPICSDPTGWPEKTQLHCTDCALSAAERLGLCVQRVASEETYPRLATLNRYVV